MSTAVAGGTVAHFVTSNRGKAYINDWYNHLPANAKADFKSAALDVYSKHGFDTSDQKELNRDQLVDQVAREMYAKNNSGAQILADRMDEYKNLAKNQIEEEFIQKTKQLRMEYFKENAPKRISEMENRYNHIEQYFLQQKRNPETA
ncbi:hypothetical protein L0222_26460 [bacterium]|nr:hypothetical protein [bacterium]MCI0605752.1 hypothetical protein [bacterium]